MERRILGELKPYEFDFQKFLRYCKEINFKDFMVYANKLKEVTVIDVEAEVVFWCCKMIVEKFKNPSKDTETIKQEHIDKINKLIEKSTKKDNIDERVSSDNTNA